MLDVDACLPVHHSLYVCAVGVHIPVYLQLCARVCGGQRMSSSVFLDCF